MSSAQQETAAYMTSLQFNISEVLTWVTLWPSACQWSALIKPSQEQQRRREVLSRQGEPKDLRGIAHNESPSADGDSGSVTHPSVKKMYNSEQKVAHLQRRISKLRAQSLMRFASRLLGGALALLWPTTGSLCWSCVYGSLATVWWVLTEEFPQWAMFSVSDRRVLWVMTHLIFPIIRAQQDVTLLPPPSYTSPKLRTNTQSCGDLSLLTTCCVVLDITEIA